MNATDVTQFSLDVPKSTSAAENPILGTWKLRSLVFEAIATGQRSRPFGDHPDGYLSYSPDGRMYAIGVAEDRPKPLDLVPTDEEKARLQASMFAYAGYVYGRPRDGNSSHRYFLESILDRNGPSPLL